jgi:hypothetical protein
MAIVRSVKGLNCFMKLTLGVDIIACVGSHFLSGVKQKKTKVYFCIQKRGQPSIIVQAETTDAGQHRQKRVPEKLCSFFSFLKD